MTTCLHSVIEVVTETYEIATLEGKPTVITETYGQCTAPDCGQRIPLDQVKIPTLNIYPEYPDLPGEIISHE
jgi:hypothetical protein